ncbi:hypothetical protein B0H11DRAFT_1826687 [Mycena galericulata]|nr:hypothetical protein B0H11DRAFT_1826687 [Mycena galericulata]
MPLKQPLSQFSTTALSPSSSACEDLSNCRTFFDIVWGCLTTIFACTWVSVHPNVPAPGQSWLKLLSRRVGMMLLAIIAPELIVFFAARQFFFARAFSKRFGVSRTHGFFFAMGGFVSAGGIPITTFKQLEEPLLGAQYLTDIRAIDVAFIMDRSKGDALSKGVALVQCFWFISQCVARVFQRLVVTELEVATLAFAVLNVFTWLLWWGKPLDAQTSILIGPDEEEQDSESEPEVSSGIWSSVLFAIYGGEYHPRSYRPVPILWSTPLYTHFMRAFLLESFSAVMFGAIHCSAWEAAFPSGAEKWIWRGCSVLITAIPALIGVMQLKPRVGGMWQWLMIVFAGTLSLYIVSRLMLIVLLFTTLRSLPQRTFMEIDWTTFIPHL